MEKFRNEDDSYPGAVTLIGSVHVSRETRERVVETIESKQPDVVAIELDRERLGTLFERASEGEHNEEGNDMIRNLLRKQQEQMLGDEDVLPSGEADMLPAVNMGVSQGARVALIDMPFNEVKEDIKSDIGIDVLEDAFRDLRENPDFATAMEIANRVRRSDVGLDILQRDNPKEAVQEVQEALGPMKDRMANGSGGQVGQLEDMSYEELSEMTEAYGEVLPEVIDNLIGKRDAHMAGHLQWLRENGYTVSAVMGRGHIAGVSEYLENPETIPEEFVVRPDWYQYSTIEISG